MSNNTAANQVAGDICGGSRGRCSKPADGTDELVWIGSKAAKGGRIDLEEEMGYWKEVDEKARGKAGICEVCGKVCKTQGGLTSHKRKCKGEAKPEFVWKAEKWRARECIEVEGRGV